MSNLKINRKTKRQSLKILTVILVILGIIIALSANTNKYVLKSEYNMNELGYIDEIEITLKSVKYVNNNTGIELSFEITNKRKNTLTIVPDEYFKFYDVNQVQIPNKFDNNTNIVKKGETVTYKLQYDVTEKELYEIYFYSQVVENNIKFSFTSQDISEDIIEDTKEEESKLE